jgi:hypothetical protein
MKARTVMAWTSHRVRLTAVGWGLTTMLACVALSACTSGSPPVTTLSPSVSGSVSTTTAGNTTSGGTPTGQATSPSPSPSDSGTQSPTPSPSPSPSPSFSPVPTAAPVTGGGGTAGFQDAGLAILGGAAIAAGLGSIAYRRRITRRR